jgi:selenocysteine-specific elongation factor
MQNQKKSHLVIGTAGHIDHGKTSLVKALTGKDLDALEEEKRRGITIDLGFAYYGDKAAFVDVPGHERLVKTMVAGAAAMRAALLVIAGDDGVMPQTREHLAVLDAMGIDKGIIVVTKSGIVEDQEWLELVCEEAKELVEPTTLAGSPVVVVDSISGKGIEDLKVTLDQLIEDLGELVDPGFYRQPVDRSFLIKGYGRVITGSVWSGSTKPNDKLVLMPMGDPVRVRGVQAHEETVDSVNTGDRAALNVQVESEPERGNMVMSAGRSVSTDFLDVAISLLPGSRIVKHRTRIRLHIGTAEAIGRVILIDCDVIQPGENGYARITLETSITAMQSDRGVIRLYSPVETLGGIRVLDPAPPDKRRTISGLKERLEGFNSTDDRKIETLVLSRKFIVLSEIIRVVQLSEEAISSVLDNLVSSNRIKELKSGERLFVDPDLWAKWKALSNSVIVEFQKIHPDEAGITKAAWAERVTGSDVPNDVVEALLKELSSENIISLTLGLINMPKYKAKLKKSDIEDAAKIHTLLKESGISVPLPADIGETFGMSKERVRSLLRSMKQVGQVVILDERVVLATEVFENTKSTIYEKFGKSEDGFILADISELFGITRKYGIPLLEYFDNIKFTTRYGDRRKIEGEIL